MEEGQQAILDHLTKKFQVGEDAATAIFEAGQDFALRKRQRESSSSSVSPTEEERGSKRHRGEGQESDAGASASSDSQPAEETVFQADTTLEGLRSELSAFAKERDWDQFHTVHSSPFLLLIHQPLTLLHPILLRAAPVADHGHGR